MPENTINNLIGIKDNMQRVSELWEDRNKALDKIDLSIPHCENSKCLDNLLGTGNWTNVADQFIKDFKIEDGMNVLEIGGGIGLLCKEFKKQKDVNYSLLDTPSMTRISKKYLGDQEVKCDFYTIDEAEKLFDKKFDLIIAINCISEMPQEFTEYILKNIHTKNAATIDGDPYNLRFDEWLRSTLESLFPSIIEVNGYAAHGTGGQIYYICKTD